MRIFGICGKNGQGRGELVAELVARFRMDGLRVAIVKRAPPSFDIDTPGTDSFRQRESGCTQTVIASDRRCVTMEEFAPDSASPDLEALLDRLRPTDIVLAINFRDADVPRLEVVGENGHDDHATRNGKWVVARVGRGIPQGTVSTFALDDFDALASFVLEHAGMRESASGPGTPMRPRAAA